MIDSISYDKKKVSSLICLNDADGTNLSHSELSKIWELANITENNGLKLWY